MIRIHIAQRPFIEWKRESPSQQAIGGIALAVCILSGSTFNSFAKELAVALSPLSLLFVSELLTFTIAMLSFGLLPTFKTIFHLKKKQLFSLLTIGLLTGVLGPFLWFAGLSYTSAINVGFFSRTEMIFLLIAAHLFLKESITRTHLSSMAAILCGMVIIGLQGFTDGIHFQIGDALIIIGSLCYAVGHLIFRMNLSHIESHLPIVIRSVVAILTFFAVSPFLEHPFIYEIRNLPYVLVPVLLGFVLVSRFLNNLSYYEAIDRLAISTVSLVASLSVIGNALFAWVYLNEPLYWYHLVGGAFIILGTILFELLRMQPHVDEKHVEQQLGQRIGH